MAVEESGNCGVGVDLGRGTPPSPLDDHPSQNSADELPDHRQGGIIRLPEPTTALARSMDPAQVEGARRAFFSNFVQNKGSLQQVLLQHGDHDLRLVGSGNDGRGHGDGGGGVREIRQLQELFMKLNPMAKEFVPPSHANGTRGSGLMGRIDGNDIGNGNVLLSLNGGGNGLINRAALRRKQNQAQGSRRLNSRTSQAQRDEIIRRTIYVSDIDHQVTEEQLASLFVGCGQVVDCRICGDPNSVLRFAFIEFTDEDGARTALNLSGTMLGFYPVRVLPSKTAIAPVNPTFLPRTEDEREMCTRTIYCTNIDKKVTQSDVKLFFESVCGEVYRLRLLGDHHHSTRIAFVEFVMAESAIAALNCSGVVLGSLPIRVSPSKTPVRPRAPRLPGN